jgi:membrane fusion protein, multidrug efflux system
MHLRTGILSLTSLLLLLIVACGGGDSAGAATQGGRGGNPGDRVIPVEIASAQMGMAQRSVTVSGTVEPIRQVGVNAQLAGALLGVFVEEGSQVREGAILARIDARELEAQVASAQANLTVTRSTFERSEQLRDAQVITAAEYDRDLAAHLAAEAQLRQLRTRLGFATIRSPISGVVTEKRVEAGDVVAPQTRLFTVADISTMVVRIPVSEMDVAQLTAGQSVAVALDALGGQQVEGRIRRIFPAADSISRLVPVEVALSGSGAQVARPGYLARVTAQLNGGREALLVPSSAVVGASGEASVFVVEDGRALRRRVTQGVTFQGQVEIISGLQAGSLVVVAGQNQLRDGMNVRVVQAPLAGDAVRAESLVRPDTARGTTQ